MSHLSDPSIFYLLGSISFFVLVVLLFIISPVRDVGALLPIGGIAVAGLLSLVAYFGTRGRGNTPPGQQ